MCIPSKVTRQLAQCYSEDHLRGRLTAHHVCPWWLAYTCDNRFRGVLRDPEKILASYVTTGTTVVDVGCGMGFFSIAAAKIVGSEGCVIAADVQPKMLGILQKRSENAGVSNVIRLHKCEHRINITAPYTTELSETPYPLSCRAYRRFTKRGRSGMSNAKVRRSTCQLMNACGRSRNDIWATLKQI
jgi:SAM-dependent methyltransferase